MKSIASEKQVQSSTPATMQLRDLDTQLLAERVARSLLDQQSTAVATPVEYLSARAKAESNPSTRGFQQQERTVGVASLDGLFEVGASSCRILSMAEFRSRLNGPNKFQALAVTGHGAEHVIQLGEGWLAASATGYGLAGDVILPDELEVPLVLLNGCSALRLVGSVVPLAHSLAARLVSRGVTVLGPFRNVRGSERIASAFVRAFLSGKSVASIVYRLNRLLRDEEGELPCIVAVGDPNQVQLSVVRGGLREVARLPTTPPAVLTDLAIEIGTARRLLDLCADLAEWDWPFNNANAAAQGTWSAMQAGRRALAAVEVEQMAEEDYEFLQTQLAKCKDALACAIQQDASDWIGSGRWLQGAYAPVRYRRIDRRFRCYGDCGRTCDANSAIVVDYRYDDPASRAATTFARECDQCGSKSEWIGAARTLAPPRCRLASPSTAIISLPMLPDDAYGCVLIHRDRAHIPLSWPSAGGSVELDLSRSNVTGRVTVVSLCVAPDGLTAQYTNLFRDPDTKALLEADTEMAG